MINDRVFFFGTDLTRPQIAEQTDLQLHTNPPQELQITSTRTEFYLGPPLRRLLLLHHHTGFSTFPPSTAQLVYISVISFHSLFTCLFLLTAEWGSLEATSQRARTGRNTVRWCFSKQLISETEIKEGGKKGCK